MSVDPISAMLAKVHPSASMPITNRDFTPLPSESLHRNFHAADLRLPSEVLAQLDGIAAAASQQPR